MADEAPQAFDDKHLPQQVPIDAVRPGGFSFASMSHQGSLMCLPDRTQVWNPSASAFDLTIDDLEPVLHMAETLDLLVIGTGNDIAVLPEDTRTALREAGLGVEISATNAAVRTFNVLLSEDRRVAAALIALT